MCAKAKANMAERAEKYLLPAAGGVSPRVISKAMTLDKDTCRVYLQSLYMFMREIPLSTFLSKFSLRSGF